MLTPPITVNDGAAAASTAAAASAAATVDVDVAVVIIIIPEGVYGIFFSLWPFPIDIGSLFLSQKPVNRK